MIIKQSFSIIFSFYCKCLSTTCILILSSETKENTDIVLSSVCPFYNDGLTKSIAFITPCSPGGSFIVQKIAVTSPIPVFCGLISYTVIVTRMKMIMKSNNDNFY